MGRLYADFAKLTKRTPEGDTLIGNVLFSRKHVQSRPPNMNTDLTRDNITPHSDPFKISCYEETEMLLNL